MCKICFKKRAHPTVAGSKSYLHCYEDNDAVHEEWDSEKEREREIE